MAEQKTQGISGGTALIGLAALGIVGYFGLDYLDKKRQREEIDKANKGQAGSEADIIKTKNKISALERGKNVTGKNASGKIVTINLVDATKEMIEGLTNNYIGQYGLTKYVLKPEPNGAKVQRAFYSIPVQYLNKAIEYYTVYTQRDFIKDIQKLDPKNLGLIKGYLNVSYKK